MALCGAVIGAAVSNSALDARLRVIVQLLAGAIVLALVVPLILGRWRVLLGSLFAWLVVEDLLRKLAGNDLRLYFVKDVIYLLVLIGLATDPGVRSTWTRATGRTRWALYALIGWGLALSVASFFENPVLPAVGMRLHFLYVPLVVAGFLMARDSARVRRWLVGLATLAAAASIVGIIQAVVGPDFLSPGQPTDLQHLELTRRTLSGRELFQPSGPFADPGRLIAASVVGVTVAFAAFVGWRKQARGPILLGIVCAAGTWAASGKAGVILVGTLALATIVSLRFGSRERRVRWAMGTATVLIVALVALAAAFPGLFRDRVEYFAQTLSPTSPVNEWSDRFDAWESDIARGIAIGGLLGTGTGQESLGRQYIFGDETDERRLSQVEGGYASLAVEWGLIGIGLWLVWSISWTRRLWRSGKRLRGSSLASATFVLFAWAVMVLFVRFMTGLSSWQDYLPNAYFWFLSGVVFGLASWSGTQADAQMARAEPSARIGTAYHPDPVVR
ncbi:MAG: hypothetical protein ACRDZ1_05795 [Acidimicrobiia bacterium]